MQAFMRWFFGYFLLNIVVTFARLFRLPRWFTRQAAGLRWVLSHFVPFPKGEFGTLPAKMTYRYSLINVWDTEFFISSLPYDRSEDLFSERTGFNDPNNVHFASLCAKLAYEHCDIVKAIVEEKWGWTFHGLFLSPMHGGDELPYETTAYLISNANCHLVIFRGTLPLSLVQWWTDAQILFTPIDLSDGSQVYVHTGFYNALEARPDPETTNVREALNEKLRDLAKTEEDHPKPVFMTGHSMGGALASVYAHSLTLDPQDNDIKGRVRGVYTFGQPRVGGQSFLARFNPAYGTMCLRYVNGGDIVTRLPLMRWGYEHHQSKRFISGMTGEIIADRQEIERECSYYQNWILAWPIWFWKLWYSALSESPLRFLTRLFIWNCVCDHFPCDYERALRRAIRKTVMVRLVDFLRDLINAVIEASDIWLVHATHCVLLCVCIVGQAVVRGVQFARRPPPVDETVTLNEAVSDKRRSSYGEQMHKRANSSCCVFCHPYCLVSTREMFPACMWRSTRLQNDQR